MTDSLVERLRERGRRTSEVLRGMAEAKSLRQDSNTERRTDLYMWPTPEQTDEWKAADRIEALEHALAEARSKAVEAVPVPPICGICGNPHRADYKCRQAIDVEGG